MVQNKPKIKEVIVVEGKTDEVKLKQLFDVDVITTNGSSISKQTLNLIKEVNQNRKVILFLDPDYQGERIRRIINNYLQTDVLNCFISKKDLNTSKKKCGIAEAYDQAIIDALVNKVSFINDFKETISWVQYLNLELNSKQKRIDLCNQLKISYTNHKQLFKRLNMMQLTFEDILNLLKQK
ncbi:ribonuclease M5 [Ureaplasma diversum]|uniref:Ribonuclease M5 n=1 Tax=Ureaplasma diversum NCTC 246 TaxID=1188241 RepID=A0A084EZ85_9BACT|nr:ribonuclease M5 [Ureaplasma diversum]KEZ23277.1 Primase-related protein [Ureaplasma diversum NCTC 246]